jgi:hypothetical protein
MPQRPFWGLRRGFGGQSKVRMCVTISAPYPPILEYPASHTPILPRPMWFTPRGSDSAASTFLYH